MPRVKNPSPVKKALGKALGKVKVKQAKQKKMERKSHSDRARYILAKRDPRGDLRRAPFRRLVRELVDNRRVGLRMQKRALEVLRVVAENAMAEIFESAHAYAVHRSTSSKDRILKSRDLLAALAQSKNPLLDGAVKAVAKVEVDNGREPSGVFNAFGKYVPKAAVMQLSEGSISDRLFRSVGCSGVPRE